MQPEDWKNAIEFIKKDDRVNALQFLLFGTSFSGGHVVRLSAHRDDVKAAVAQCPYTNTMATIRVVGLKYILKKAPFVIADVPTCVTGYHPVLLKLSTYSGENAFMEADEELTDRYFEKVSCIKRSPVASSNICSTTSFNIRIQQQSCGGGMQSDIMYLWAVRRSRSPTCAKPGISI